MDELERRVGPDAFFEAADLEGIEPADLARYVADTSRHWYRRRACLRAVRGRIPEESVGALVARVMDPSDVAEIRTELLDQLGGRRELLGWLVHEDRQGDVKYGMREAILKARGAAGDLTAAKELTTLAFDPWSQRRVMGDAGLDALIERYGTDVVAGIVRQARPEDRAFALRLAVRAGRDVTAGLADPDPRVAYLAQGLVDDPAQVRAFLAIAPTVDATLWAAYALHRLTGDLAETQQIYEALGRPRVDVPELDEDVRRSIVAAWAFGCEPPSDPRWRVEGLCLPPLPPSIPGLKEAVSALAVAGLDPGPPVSAGKHRQQGYGTYDVIPCPDGDVVVSELGPFAAVDRWGPAEVGDALESSGAPRLALERAGFRWIDGPRGDVTVDGLCVYFFGSREPLSVFDLLFYWQD